MKFQVVVKATDEIIAPYWIRLAPNGELYADGINVSDRYILRRFTGIKDVNDVEVYEGDIYHMGDKNITYTVVWHDTGFMGKQNGSSSYAGLESWKSKIVVVGNIYNDLVIA